MDCLEFRRKLGIDPRVSDPEARAHLESCPRCAEAYARAQAFESRIARAMTVGVPEGFADRILLAQLTAQRQRNKARVGYGWIALAAAACLVVAIGVVRYGRAPSNSLPDLVVRHVNGDERDMLGNRTPVPPADVDRAFADRGVHLQSVPAGITYVSECPVGEYRTVHMVMPQNDEPVSVLYITRHRVAAMTDFERGTLRGREVPIADGTLVLLGENASHFDSHEHAWHDALEGTAAIAAGAP